MDIKAKIIDLSLPKNSFVVVGSGILAVLGLRQSDDIDLIVTKELFEKLKIEGWETSYWQDQVVLKKDVYDVGTTWLGQTLEELLPNAQTINGIPFLSLTDLRQWKTMMGRPKDLKDIALIDAYTSRSTKG